MENVIRIKIWTNVDAVQPSYELPDVPWFPGISVLQAMIIGEALHPKNFTFRVVYRSVFGAFVDSIDGVADEDKPNHFWMLYINGEPSNVGATEALIFEDENVHSALVEWRYVDIGTTAHPQVRRKTAPVM